MKRAAILLASSALAAAFGAASCSRPPAPAAESGTLTRHLDGDPATLDPIVNAEELGMRVQDLLFRSLVGYDKNRRIVPALALSWAASSDGLVYDFRLDPKARWEDGTPVTSEDVAFTIERIRDPKVPAVNWKGGFEDVRSVETPDPSTVIVRFQKPDAGRLYWFTMPVVSAAAYRRGTGLDRQPVGSGPYRLESWIPNQKIVLVRRADADPAKAAFARIVFRSIPDGSVRYRAGSLGELDEFKLSRGQRMTAMRLPEFLKKNRIVKSPQFSIVQLTWNVRNPWLADPHVRLALSRAWNRAEAAKALYPPEGADLIDGPYPAGSPENAPEVRHPAYDPAEAARMLDAAGLKAGPDGFRRRDGKKVSLEILYPSDQPIYAQISEVFRAAVQKLGIEVVARPFDWAAYSQRYAAGEFDVSPLGQQFLPPNLDQYPFFHSSQAPPAGLNAGFYRNPAADRALEAARREMDDGRRLELLRTVHRLLAADPPADFLWSADQYWAVSSRLDGVEISPVGLFHFLPGPLAWRAIPPRR